MSAIPSRVFDIPEVPHPNLERSFFERRSLINGILNIAAWIIALVACVPLFSVLIMLIMRGSQRIGWDVFTELPPTAFEIGGGFGNAIMGTVVMVGLGALLSVPIGILAATFLSEVSPDSKISQVARFCAKTLTGLPSILAGVFAYASVVLLTGTVLRSGGRGRSRPSDGPYRDAYGRRGHENGASHHEGCRFWNGMHSVPSGVEGSNPYCDAGNHNGSNVSRGPGCRRNRAIALYGAVQ